MIGKRALLLGAVVGCIALVASLGDAFAAWTQASDSTEHEASPMDGDLMGHVGYLDDYGTGARTHYGYYNSSASGQSYGPAPRSLIRDSYRNDIEITWDSSSSSDGYKLLNWYVAFRTHGQGQSNVVNGATFHLDSHVWLDNLTITLYDSGGSSTAVDENYKDATKYHAHLDGNDSWAKIKGQYALAGSGVNILAVPGNSPAAKLVLGSYQSLVANGDHPPEVSSYWAVLSDLQLDAKARLGEN